MQEPFKKSDTKRMQVLFFGALADITGTEILEIEITNDTDKIKETLLLLYPALKKQTFKMALNQSVLTGKQTLKEGDVIALLAPFAGG